MIRAAKSSELTGATVQGRIHYNFDDLVDYFGQPTYLFDDIFDRGVKVRCQWDIVIDGEPISIYDWCEYDTPVSKVEIWYVGGHSVKTIQNLMAFISEPFKDILEYNKLVQGI